MLKAIETGFIQGEIQDSSYAYQQSIDTKDQIIVGVNEYQIQESQTNLKTLKINPEVEDLQQKRLTKIKRERDQTAVDKTLKHIQNAAMAGENLMPPIIAAVKAYATLQEISDTLRQEFGEYRERIVV